MGWIMFMVFMSMALMSLAISLGTLAGGPTTPLGMSASFGLFISLETSTGLGSALIHVM